MADEIENKDSHSGNTTVSSNEEKKEKQNVISDFSLYQGKKTKKYKELRPAK